MEDLTTGQLVAGLLSILLTVFFFVVLARIEASTRRATQLLEQLLQTAQSIDSRNALEARERRLARESPEARAPESV